MYKRQSRPITFLAVGGFLLLLFLFFIAFPHRIPNVPSSWENNLDKLKPDRLLDTISSATGTGSHRSRTPRKECMDPYRRPGYLDYYFGEQYNKTRWIPFDDDFYDQPDPVSAVYTPANETDSKEGKETLWWNRNSRPPSSVRNSPYAPRDWFADVVREDRRRRIELGLTENGTGEAVDFAPLKEDGPLPWLWGRVFLLLSDSLDRLQMQFFCQEVSNSSWNSVWHQHAECFVPSHNLTFLHWHLPGMPSHKPVWWWNTHVEVVPFEERWDRIFNATADRVVGANGKGPDLVLWQSAVWDRRNLREAMQVQYGLRKSLLDLPGETNWEAIRWYASRVRQFLQFVRGKFGEEQPLMLRTATLDRQAAVHDFVAYDLDRVARGVGERFGVEVFEWGRILSNGREGMYQDYLHVGRGPGSWLWSNMMLEYMARAVGIGVEGGAPEERKEYFSGWGACHDELMDWGGR